MKTILVLSIRASHAENILEGRKKVELRKVRPKLEPGDIVLIYAPRPVMALIGGFTVKEVIVARPGRLWRQGGNVSGLTKQQFTQYYSGASVAVGICIDTIWRLPKPVPLAVLRRCWVGFVPPQCFRYLGDKEMRLAKSFNVNLMPDEAFSGAKSISPLFEVDSSPRLKTRGKRSGARSHCLIPGPLPSA